MLALDLVLLGTTLLGSAALWLTVFNNVHAGRRPWWVHKTMNVVIYVGFFGSPLAILFVWWQTDVPMIDRFRHGEVSLTTVAIGLCWFAAGGWILQRFRTDPSDPDDILVANDITRHDLLVELGPSCIPSQLLTCLARVPGNQLVQLAIEEKTLRIPRLPPALGGLSIAHLTDLHLTGMIGKPYFQEVVRLANQREPDLAVVTGDIVDQASCFDWIAETLGQLEARYGAYFVLGNHDLRVDRVELRKRLTDAGLIDLGGRWTTVAGADAPIVLAGNELPWHEPAADLADAPPRGEEGPFRIALCHTPDVIAWSCENQIDLMLAGHTHGGQIRLPWAGPLASSCRKGTRYVAGVYYEAPTVLHISRGLSQILPPVRFNCAPELAILRLQSGP